MFQIGKANSCSDVNIIFQFPKTINSVTQFGFKIINEPLCENTKLVSGLDVNKQINCVFTRLRHSLASNYIYVLSMFRLHQLVPDIVTKLNTSVVRILTYNANEYWYVFGIKRNHELASATIYERLLIENQQYDKVVCVMSGNIPNDLLKAFNNKVKDKNFLHALCVQAPASEVNSATVRVIKSTA